MAIATPTNIQGAFSTADATTYTCTIFNYTSGYLYIYGVGNALVASVANPTPSSAAGLTWATLYTQTSSAGTQRLTVFYCIPAGTGTETLTWTFGGQTQTRFSWTLDEIASGFDAATPFVQSTGNKANSSASVIVTLGAFGATDNATYGFFGVADGGSAMNAGSGFTRSGFAANTDAWRVASEFQNPNNNDTTVNMAGSSGVTWVGIAAEIKAAAAATYGFNVLGSPIFDGRILR